MSDGQKRVFLVACVSRKKTTPAPARDLYQSPWFLKAKSYVEAQGVPWFILSAKHGLVEPDTELEPYNQTLSTAGVEVRRQWTAGVLEDLKTRLDGPHTIFFLAGRKYRQFLQESLLAMGHDVQVPMNSMGIGHQLAWLTKEVELAEQNKSTDHH